MEVAERRPFPASSAAENGSEIANRNSFRARFQNACIANRED